jgi:hypothetical protein
MIKKLFFILTLVALVAASLPAAVFAQAPADEGKFKQFASINKYSVQSMQPLVLRFSGQIACDKAVVATSANGKDLYVTISDIKVVASGKPCSSTQNKGYTKQVNFGVLTPGTYTVYVNLNTNGKFEKKFKVVAPALPVTKTPAP